MTGAMTGDKRAPSVQRFQHGLEARVTGNVARDTGILPVRCVPHARDAYVTRMLLRGLA